VNVVRVRVRDQGTPSTRTVPEGTAVAAGQTVVLEGQRGTTYGVAAGASHPLPEVLACCQRPRGAIFRVADADDLAAVDQLRRREEAALDFCRERVLALGLKMKVTDMEGVLDGKNLTCTFTADRRVDFRQVVKDMGGRFHCHVLMHQIGNREEARRACGIGPCGRELCCSTFLDKPIGVTSKDARRIAPGVAHAKLTGVCGKLMCCLAYEDGAPEREDALVRLA
jgi:cell fate regulator YaaT (PSP1 superfamily)